MPQQLEQRLRASALHRAERSQRTSGDAHFIPTTEPCACPSPKDVGLLIGKGDGDLIVARSPTGIVDCRCGRIKVRRRYCEVAAFTACTKQLGQGGQGLARIASESGLREHRECSLKTCARGLSLAQRELCVPHRREGSTLSEHLMSLTGQHQCFLSNRDGGVGVPQREFYPRKQSQRSGYRRYRTAHAILA